MYPPTQVERPTNQTGRESHTPDLPIKQVQPRPQTAKTWRYAEPTTGSGWVGP